MDENSAFCLVCAGAKPCCCRASKVNADAACCVGAGRCSAPVARTDTRKGVSPKWSAEQDQWVKTNLETCRGGALTDSTMNIMEERKLEALLLSTAHAVLILTVHVGFITLRHDVSASYSGKIKMNCCYNGCLNTKTVQ